MTTFATERVEAINTREGVYQLTINGKKQLEEFETSLRNKNYLGEYRTLLKYVEYAANGGTLPVTKLRILKPGTNSVTEYEFKGKHLRFYAIQQRGKKVIILLGSKNTQDSDIISFRSLKQKYLDYKKQKECEKKRPYYKP